MPTVRSSVLLFALLTASGVSSAAHAQTTSGRYELRYETSGAVLRDAQSNREYKGAELYRVLGRDDLARQYEAGAAKRATKLRRTAVLALGGATLIAGGITMVTISNRPTESQLSKHDDACQFSNDLVSQNCRVGEARKSMRWLNVTGWVTAIAGGASMVLGIVLIPGPDEPDPVLPAELQKIVEQANQRPATLRLEIQTTPSSAGLALRLRF